MDVNLDLPWSIDLKSKISFIVCRDVDLNLNPELAMPCEVEKSKRFCCLFCKSDPILITVRIPRTGFALGEQIPVHVELINDSKRKIINTEFSLRRIDLFKSNKPVEATKEVKKVIKEFHSGGADGGATVKFEEMILIPHDLIPSNDRYCKIFQISYDLMIKANTGSLSISPCLYIPITIGTVGIRQSISRTSTAFSGARILTVSSVEKF